MVNKPSRLAGGAGGLDIKKLSAILNVKKYGLQMAEKIEEPPKIYGRLKGKYTQKSVRERIEALFLDNIGKIITREQIVKVATDPKTQKQPENWHQRLSELRTDNGYTILSWRNRGWLRVEEYLMPTAEKRQTAGKRARPDKGAWEAVLQRARNACEWTEGNEICGLKEGEIDPVGG